MNDKYLEIALYHTIINFQLELVVDALNELEEYEPELTDTKKYMSALKITLADKGRVLLEKVLKEDEYHDK